MLAAPLAIYYNYKGVQSPRAVELYCYYHALRPDQKYSSTSPPPTANFRGARLRRRGLGIYAITLAPSFLRIQWLCGFGICRLNPGPLFSPIQNYAEWRKAAGLILQRKEGSQGARAAGLYFISAPMIPTPVGNVL